MNRVVKTLPTTTARLLAVAALLEEHPELWEQGEWAQSTPSPETVATTHTCGTYGCIAGWGVAMTPAYRIRNKEIVNWYEAGRVALGIDVALSDVLFSGNYKPANGPSATLRMLAEVPVRERTLKRVFRSLVELISDDSYMNLSNVDLSGVNMSGLRMRWFDFWSANLREANLRDVDLSHAKLTKTDARWADLGGAVLKSVHAYAVKLTDADLRGADMERAGLEDAVLVDANLAGAGLRYAYLEKANLQGANLRGADFTGATLDDANFTDADLTGAIIDIPAAKAVGAIFTGAKLP